MDALTAGELSSKRRERSPSDPEVAQSQVMTKPAAKRPKVAGETLSAGIPERMPNDDSAMPSLDPALKIKRVLDDFRGLPEIGHCRTKLHEAKFGKEDQYVYAELLEEFEEKIEQEVTPNEMLVKELAQVYAEGSSVTSGKLDKPFRLRVTHPGCEVEKDITICEDQNEDMLRQLFNHSTVAGYGDVQTQETKVDESVRSAREISTSGFSVPPQLIEEIRSHWSKNFIPSRVRVEPYKIHTYGPGGHFKAHRDTPANGLVGTFLVGLGDTTGGDHLEVGSSCFKALAGRWVAFYPDTPHRVSQIRKGYRAVIAFKMYRESIGQDEIEDRNGPLVARIRACVSKMKAPFGLFLEHKYCMGTQHLSGMDAVVHSSLQRLDGVQVRLLPIVTRCGSTWRDHDGCEEEEDEEDCFWADVYPFTTAHVEYSFALNSENSEDKARAKKALNTPSLSWLRDMNEHVPFYYTDLKATTITWSSEVKETINHTGNEAEAWREDSIYLSYAIVVLPIKKPNASSEAAAISH
ncbi:hypothetical protein EVG20_g3022 [Dentipellis fragilis]|uniref:Prolyl 4-hydroxylase alpha subunit Fe(2+) 2OG dioxygenase domain-containing protein n=1 Tax=Dentipellis fragilis TaxID=205917 RepID=A0A4Y9Z4G0_9AGAM|nr:hypothetical protein EVG20_g3022 [Dentipellis fragilis]